SRRPALAVGETPVRRDISLPAGRARFVGRAPLALATALLAVLLLAACSSSSKGGTSGEAGADADFTAKDGLLNVATTVAPLTNIVRNIGGTRIHIHGLIPDGVDSHTFEPKPSDAKVL